MPRFPERGKDTVHRVGERRTLCWVSLFPGGCAEAALGISILVPLTGCARQNSTLTLPASSPAPPRLPGRSTPPRPSLLARPPALSAGLRGSRTIASRRHRPRPQAGSLESFLLLHPALPPPARRLPSRLPGRVRKRVRPLPRPPPGPGPPPPSRRTYPLAGRPRARDRDRAERSRRASATPPARAPSGSELRAELSCLAPRHPRG